MNKFKQIRIVLVIGVLLLASCRQSGDENVLEHPALSLVEHDSSKIFFDPSWSPDGNNLSLMGYTPCLLGHCRQDPYILELATGEISSFKKDWYHYVIWTSDPDTVSYYDSNNDPQGIFVTDFNDTSSPEFIVEGKSPFWSWSPDGLYLAFSRSNSGRTANDGVGPGVFVLDMETKKETKVFDTLGKEIIGMSWSPDSKWLAIATRWFTPNNNYDSGIFIFDRNGEEVQQLIEKEEVIGYGIGWMPDGQWFYYLKDGMLSFAPLNFECVIQPLDVQLEGISYPVISPDGEKIVLEHRGDIYLLSLDTLLGENQEFLICP